jgi:hypothetical protein
LASNRELDDGVLAVLGLDNSDPRAGAAAGPQQRAALRG